MSTGLDVFDSSIEKTNKILKEIEKELDWQNHRNQSYSALRSVLHALRDRLPLNDAVNFSAQLPLLLKGVFFDGWEPEEVPVKMNKEEFLERIQREVPFYQGEISEAVRIVVDKIFDAIDPLEGIKIQKSLPDDLKPIFSHVV